jgi:hypothetical protein
MLRLHAVEKAAGFLSRKGWLVVGRDGIDVLAVKHDGTTIAIKFWISSTKKPVPKSFLKRFDKAVQSLRNDKPGATIRACFISNSALDKDAYSYYKNFAEYTMKLTFTAPDIKDQIARINKKDVPLSEHFKQATLGRFAPQEA